jgi:ferredoxin-fold anticodon binding domain-containing protein
MNNMHTVRIISEEDYSEVIEQLDLMDADLGSLLNHSNDEESVLKLHKSLLRSLRMLGNLLAD